MDIGGIKARIVRASKTPPMELRFEQKSVRGKDFSGRRVDAFISDSSQFSDCNFSDMVIKDASFGVGQADSLYEDCVFDGISIDSSVGNRARFVRCSFRNMTIKKFMCTATDFIDCVFSGVVKQGQFWGNTPEYLPRRVNHYDGNDFSGLSFRDVDFRCGIDLTRQVLPGGPEYVYVVDAEKAIQRARGVIMSWSDEESRKDALGFLGVLEGVVSEGQQQLIMRRFEKDDTANAVLDLLVTYAQ